MRQGIDPAVEEQKERREAIRKQAITFAAVAEDFVREKLPGERKGKDVEREIRRDLLPKWGKLAITDIVDLDVSALIKVKGRDGKVGARNLLALIKRLFRWSIAQPEYGVSISPCANLRATDILGEMPRSKGRVLSNDELFALWRAARRMPYPAGPAYQMLCLTAVRLNEAVDGSWSEFNMREKVWVIPAERMKGKDSGKKQARPHAVPLTPDILESPRDTATVQKRQISLLNDSRPQPDLDRDEGQRPLGQSHAADAARVSKVSRRESGRRRTFAFRKSRYPANGTEQLSRLKVTEEAREAVLAHARPGIKGTYDLYDYLDEKCEALELWAARLRQIVSPPPDNVVKFRATA